MIPTLGIVLVVFGVIFIFKTLISISPYQKGVRERLSQFNTVLDDGWHFIIPFIDKIIKVDMREKMFNTGSHEMITRDNAVVTVDAIIYMQVIDPRKAVYDIDNPYNAVIQLALAYLRSMIGQLSLDECLSERTRINTYVQTHLSEETAKWGLRITKAEIQRIEPPADLTASMQEQKKAEQEKRAQMLRAEGFREAAIREAEGVKQKEILEAEGKAQAMERMAQAKAKALEMEATAAITYFKDNAVLKEQLKVFEEALKGNTKYILDADIFKMLKSMLNK